MKLKSLILILLFALAAQILWSQELATLNIQGVLRDNTGRAQPDGIYSITFSIYDQEVGGSPLWTDTHNDVQVTNGVFNAVLGSKRLFSEDNLSFDKAYWVGMRVGVAQEILPRIQLTSAPYALSLIGGDNRFPSSGTVEIGLKNPTNLNVNGKVQESGDDLIPAGVIVMWSGTAIPAGWALCDGTNSTPNLIDRFVMSSKLDEINSKGGTDIHQHLVDSHAHSITHDHPSFQSEGVNYSSQTGANPGGGAGDFRHRHIVNPPLYSGNSGSSAPGTNTINHLPPYYKLAYIMKL